VKLRKRRPCLWINNPKGVLGFTTGTVLQHEEPGLSTRIQKQLLKGEKLEKIRS
jgi:hypothetical protein